LALGAMGSAAAANVLAATKPQPPVVAAVTDASLACAEGLLKSGDKSGALAIYKRCAAGSHPKNVLLAATRGGLACAGH
jgi:hypothetical protein